MADIRIKDLATTAASTASDDFVAVDGSANGTRKLNAYSPTFGGNLTVSGTGGSASTISTIGTGTNAEQNSLLVDATTSGTPAAGYGPSIRFTRKGNDGGSSSTSGAIKSVAIAGTSGNQYNADIIIAPRLGGSLIDALTVKTDGGATIAGNLTVSGTGTNLLDAGAGTDPLRINSTAASPTWIKMTSGATTLGSIARVGNDFVLKGGTSGAALTLNFGDTGASFSGNLTVSGQTTNLGTGGASIQAYSSGTMRLYSASGQAIALFDGGSAGLTLDGSHNATLAGNLTVSGTGTSSVGGLFDANAGLRAVSAPSFSASTGKGVEMLYISTSDIGYVQSYDRTGSAYKLLNVEGSTLRLNSGSGGNVLLGTQTDSANGKLQLATHTTSAGGIGFGTDISLYRSGANTLFTNASTFTLPSTGDLRWDGGGYVTIGASSSLVFRNLSAATILTLEGSSQNATFAGLLKTSGGDVRIGSTYAYTWFKDATPTKAWGIGTNGWAGLTGGDGSMIFGVYTSPTWSKALEIDQSANATFAGAIAIGNTVNSVSPTSPNRTITMVIGGTTYYIHAKTTND